MQEKTNFALISAAPFWMETAKSSEAMTEHSYHYHDCYQLYYLFSGELYYFIKDKTYLIKPGNLVLVKSYDIHCTTTSSAKSYERLIIDFKREFFEDFISLCTDINLFECFDKSIHVIKLGAHQQSHIEALFKSISREYSENKAGSATYLKSLLIQLLIYINRHSDTAALEGAEYANSAHKTISEITAYINNNFSEDLSLSDIAEKYYISSYYLSRIFKKITGMSFTEYINGVRIKEAEKLLLRSKLGISKISEAVGYKSCTHFGRVFKEITGVSPSKFKKANTGEN